MNKISSSAKSIALPVFAVLIALLFFVPQAVHAAASMNLTINTWADISVSNGSGSAIVTVKNVGEEVLEDVEVLNTTPPMPDWLVMSVSPSSVNKLNTAPVNFTITFSTTRPVEAGLIDKVWLYAHAKGDINSEPVYLNVRTVGNNGTTPPQPQGNGTAGNTTPPANNQTANVNITSTNATAQGNASQGNATNGSGNDTILTNVTQQQQKNGSTTTNNQSGSAQSSKGISDIYILGIAAAFVLLVAIIAVLFSMFKRRDQEKLGPRVLVHGRVARKTDEGFALDIGGGTLVLVHTKEKVVDRQYLLIEGYYVNTLHGNEIYAVRVEPYGESIMNDPFF